VPFFPGDEFGKWGSVRGVELGEEAMERRRVREEVVEKGAEEYGGCVAAGGDIGGGPGGEGPNQKEVVRRE
jgi:hypothetical protein